MKDSYAKGKSASDAFAHRESRFLQSDFSAKIMTIDQHISYHKHIKGTHGYDFAICYKNSVKERNAQWNTCRVNRSH